MPISDFSVMEVSGKVNKRYCNGTISAEFNETRSFTSANASDVYALLPKVQNTFDNDRDLVELSLKLKAYRQAGGVYESTYDYKEYEAPDIPLDIYNFYYYVTLVFTSQSVQWTKLP